MCISWCEERPRDLLRTRIQNHFPRLIQSHPRESKFRRRSPGQLCTVDKKEGSRTPGGTGPGVSRRHPAPWQWLSLRPVMTGRHIHQGSLRQMTVFAPQSGLTFAAPWTVAHQAPLSRRVPRQECWSVLPFPSPGDLTNPRLEPRSPALQVDSLQSEPQGKPR